MSEEHDVLPPPRPRRPTMIKGLIPRLPERGHIKIGELGAVRKSTRGNDYQLPQKLDHFRVTTLDRDPKNANNFVIDQALYERLDLPEKPTELPVRLLYDDLELNFPTRYACYAGQKLWCVGDGEQALRASKEHGQNPLPEPFPVACPCHRIEPTYKGKDVCKINGRLSVLIDGAGGIGGVWVFRTTSYNSVTGILSSLAFIRNLTGGILANIPLTLRLQKKRAANPNDGSGLDIWVASLEYPGNASELLETAHDIALHRAQTHLSIANIEEEARRQLAYLPDAALPGDVAEDIVGEFYPEQIEEEEPPPPRPRREDFRAQEEAPPDTETEEPPPYTDEDIADLANDTTEEYDDEPTFGGEPPESYELVNEDGEVEHVPLDRVVERCTQIYQDAAKRGVEAWKAASEVNPVQALRDAGHDIVAQEVIQAWKDARPAEKPPTRQLGNTPPQPPRGAGGAPTRELGNGQAPRKRNELWSRSSYLVNIPSKPNRTTDFPKLRDIYIDMADEVMTGAELRKFIEDNSVMLRSLREAYPNYEKQVRDKFHEVEIRVATAAEEARASVPRQPRRN